MYLTFRGTKAAVRTLMMTRILPRRANWAGPWGGVKTLESFDPQHEYQWVLSNSTKDSEVTCMAEILQIDTHENDQRRRGGAVCRTTNRDATASAALAMSRF
jgi:hypothetical protein